VLNSCPKTSFQYRDVRNWNGGRSAREIKASLKIRYELRLHLCTNLGELSNINVAQKNTLVAPIGKKSLAFMIC
jgi:hypothetical protein